MADELTHLDASGRARMVDVGAKEVTHRCAVATATVRMSPATRARLLDGTLPKGDAAAVARIAGIQAAKRTSELIPLCHPVRTDSVEVAVEPEGEDRVRLTATVRARDRTGVEMEALSAAAVAALTLYDMIKSVEKGAEIERVRLERKSGGVSGDYVRASPEEASAGGS